MDRFKRMGLAVLLGFTASALTGGAQGAEEDIALVAPAAVPQDSKAPVFVIAVRDDGTATLRLQPRAGAGEQTLDLEFTQLTAGSKTAFVGFRGPDPSVPLAHQEGVKVGADGVDLPLVTIGLERGVAYTGTLSARLGRQKAIQWPVSLTQPPLAPMITCPTEPLTVAPDGSVEVALPVAGFAGSESASARLGPFISGTKESADVDFRADKQPLPHQVAGLPVKDGELRFTLRTTGMAEGSTYEGPLSLTLGQRAPQSCKLKLLVPTFPKGELAAEPSAITRQVNLPFFFYRYDPFTEKFHLRLWEKTGTKAVARIDHTLDGASEAPDGTFDLGQHATITYGGKENKRDLARGEKLDVDVELKHLAAGKYSFALSFAGSGGAPPAKVPFTVNVRHHVLWAVLAVLASLVASYLLTKGIVYWRERIAIRQRIAQQKRVTLGEYDYLPSYTFWRAVLAQSELLIRGRWFLPPPPSVKDYLDRAERVMKVLQKYGELDRALERIPADDDYMKHHYRNARDDAMSHVGVTQPLDQATADKVIQDLAAIITRLEEPKTWYWSQIQKKAADLLGRAELAKEELELAAGQYKTAVDDIFKILRDPGTGPGRKFDNAYWRLDLLYRWRKWPEDVKALHEAFNKHGHIDAMFAAADKLAWKRLTDAKPGTISIVTADNRSEYEALEPIKFAVRFDDDTLAETYLVRHLLHYEWTFKNTPEAATEGIPEAPTSPPGVFGRLWRRVRGMKPQGAQPQGAQPPPTLMVKSPRVTRFALASGALEADLVIRRRDPGGAQQYPPATKAPLTKKVTIVRNTELGLIRSLDQGEIYVMLAVAALALVTSLTALWHAKPAFGSFVDYVAILTWAFSIDQGKNLIQLQNVFQPSGTSRATT